MLPPNILHRNKKLITIFHFTLPNSERENYHTKIEKRRRRRKNLMRSRNKKKTHHMTVPYSKVPDMHSRAQWSLFNF